MGLRKMMPTRFVAFCPNVSFFDSSSFLMKVFECIVFPAANEKRVSILLLRLWNSAMNGLAKKHGGISFTSFLCLFHPSSVLVMRITHIVRIADRNFRIGFPLRTSISNQSSRKDRLIHCNFWCILALQVCISTVKW